MGSEAWLDLPGPDSLPAEVVNILAPGSTTTGHHLGSQPSPTAFARDLRWF